MNNKLLDTSNAAKRIGNLKPNTLEIWRVKGTGPKYVKIGRLVRYRIEDLDAYLVAQIRSSTSEVPA